MILYICYSLCLYYTAQNIILQYATHARLLFIDRAGRKMCQDALCRPTSLAERSHADRPLFFLPSPYFSHFPFWLLFFFLFLYHLRASDVFDSANGPMRVSMLEHHPSVLGCRKKKFIINPLLRLWLLTRIERCFSNSTTDVNVRVRYYSRIICLGTSADGWISSERREIQFSIIRKMEISAVYLLLC